MRAVYWIECYYLKDVPVLVLRLLVAGSAVLAGLSPVAVVLAGSASPSKCSTSTKTAAIAASGVGTETIIAVWDPSAVRLTTWPTSVAL